MSSAPDDAPRTAAEAFLHTLARLGVEHLYVGAGTDTAPVIEAYARQNVSGLRFPQPVVTAHENLAVGMAHGYYMVSRKPQALMLHVSVGAANAVCGIMNAARAQVPVFLAAGRTPLLERGRFGARDNTVHWGQEMFDQAGMLREFTKWDYELRDAANTVELVERAHAIAMAEPRGPVYLTLPREVLASEVPQQPAAGSVCIPAAPHPDREAVRELARKLDAARFPVIVCTASGTDPRTLQQLASLADRFAIAVAESKPRVVNFPSSHALHAGFDVAGILREADALLFLESDVPWLPGKAQPRSDAFVAHAGTDPLFASHPVRHFRADLLITGTAGSLLTALAEELENLESRRAAERRRARLSAFAASAQAAAQAQWDADEARGGAISKIFLSRCLDQVQEDDTAVVSEYSALRECMRLDQPDSFFLLPNAGGLGWGLPAALGARQARPNHVVFAALGDGAYVFANPAACHHASAMHGLPVATVVFDNGGWDAVHKTALAVYPDSHLAEHVRRHGRAPLSDLSPIPEFTSYVTASGGLGIKVSRREELVPALRRAADSVRRGVQALVHVKGR